ncbi:hypothetical protein AV521_17190 [Streptomyces sp. IMTB 2501]|nr:hypothetical protein AV521_17190 [Streptomyces sp. IMTB 2501]
MRRTEDGDALCPPPGVSSERVSASCGSVSRRGCLRVFDQSADRGESAVGGDRGHGVAQSGQRALREDPACPAPGLGDDGLGLPFGRLHRLPGPALGVPAEPPGLQAQFLGMLLDLRQPPLRLLLPGGACQVSPGWGAPPTP